MSETRRLSAREAVRRADELWSRASSQALRPDLARIAGWIDTESRVLDLGCGDGTLLAHLRDKKSVDGAGVEFDDARVISAVRRGVRVVQQNLEEGLALFDDQQFDSVVLSQTLQAMHHTEHILREMARVARYGIVSFPNFGYWPHGFSILRGRMPVTGEMPYQWYDTPNIHLCTLKDFEALASKLGLRITHLATFNGGKEVKFLAGWRSTLAVYRFESPMAAKP
ncbi:methionine biosynthesis protein MetW [Pusillimonas noertemannii]|uniref:Methionine biosynthesis protein MetW n=1 Tax=Pusillimonas noertemannii TaxID=305977 RepID=A0A2U1CQC8_9BURK|nr:methionine biosynthesis protein MetW [Pusillimonas noertemannii]PVY68102.1 methionine biosynthesis protein MetW [Pusillimonas noertemannii]